MVRKIFIYTSEEVKKMKPGRKISSPSIELEEAGGMVAAAFFQKETHAE